MSGNFNGSLYVSEQLNRQMVNMVKDFGKRCVLECASIYKFDGEEAMRLLGLDMVKMERKVVAGGGSGSGSSKVKKEEKTSTRKAAFPLPYNGEFEGDCCYALRQNNGLYTQCTGSRRNGSDFCKSCCSGMQKSGCETPEYGTIQGRNAVGIFEYVDPKGRKPTPYTKVMKKYKISEEQVLEEAGKLNIVINPQHFVAPEETKRGRPKTEKEPKEKGVKGRPKKSKKVVEIKEDDDDLFATLVANANEDAEEMILPNEAEKEASVKAEKEAKKAAEKAAKEAEKAEKEAKKAAEKAEKEAKLAAEKAEKEAKKAAEKAEKEAKIAAEKAEKEAKLAAEKAEKEAKKSTAKKSAKPAKDEAAKEDEEQEVLKKIEYQGKKYLKSKKSGIIYDYDVYRATEDLVIIGKWNDNTNKIVFEKVDNDSDEDSDEESEDEYDN